MTERSTFVFTTCQPGVEWALKAELAKHHPELRFAYSRPGFVTFRVAQGSFAPDATLNSIFARTHGLSLDKVTGTDRSALAAQLWQLVEAAELSAPTHLHVWERDTQVPGERGFEPGISPLAADVAQLLRETRPAGAGDAPSLNHVARPGETILDVILVEPDQWWIGWHMAGQMPSRWPGGVPLLAQPPNMISRAYLKIAEALLWSRLPIEAGDHVVELGSAPGGSCQALLDRGLVVTGIDPAEMNPLLLSSPHFTHVRKRGADLKRREYRPFKWLTADLNVAPTYTLDTVEGIVTHAEVNMRGLLLTLKMLDRNVYAGIESYLERIRSWGYAEVRARQLSHNRQEICVAALK